MQNGLAKFDTLFNGYAIYNVPRYQRAYAWEKKNLEEFLDDLKNQIDSVKSYFLGTLLFHQREKRNVLYDVYDIVDGQQRLTTAMIFLKVLLDNLKDMNSSIGNEDFYKKYVYDGKVFRLEVENEDNNFLHQIVFNGKNNIEPKTPSQKRLFNAKIFFEKELKKIKNREYLEKMFEKLITSDILLYVVNNISDATLIFELLNDRGKRLTQLEGIKSFLMYIINGLNLEEYNQPIIQIQDNFASIYRDIEEYNLPEDDVIRYYIIAFEYATKEESSKPKEFIKYKLHKKLSENDNNIKNYIIDLSNNLKESYDIYKSLKINSLKSESLDLFKMIGRTNPFYPILIWFYRKDQNNLDEFLSKLNKFTFRAQLIGLRTDAGINDFYKWYRDKRKFEVHWIYEPIKNNWWNINERVEDVLNYNNFYEWVNKNITKLILFLYENHLREKEGYPLLTIDDFFSTDKRKKLNIEHITAINRIEFKDEDFEENYLHSLGNLVLDTTSSNSRKGNKPVSEKEKKYKFAPFMSQNEIVSESVNWNDLNEVKAFINKRKDKLVNFIREYIL